MPLRERPKISDVAAEAGVSPATVSRALSQPDLVRPLTRARIEAAVSRLGYVPDGAARALASRSNGAVGIVVPTIDNAIFSRAIQALQTRLAEAGIRLLVASHEYDVAAEAGAVRSLLEHGIDGIVLVGTEHTKDVWALLDRAPIPSLLTWSMKRGRDCIGFDNQAAGRLVAEHLLSLGHCRFGVISGSLIHNDRAKSRLAGVRAALAAAGRALPPDRISEQPFSLGGGRAGFAALMSSAEQPTAIIGGNDLLATGALFEAQARGLVVPRDVSIVGFDNLELAANVSPGLTTIHLPTAELGRLAAERLLSRLEASSRALNHRPRIVRLPVELIVRASTAPPRRSRQKSD